MPDAPTGADLLKTARSSLLKELMPHLDESLHRSALMIANAMAIAARELEEKRNSDELLCQRWNEHFSVGDIDEAYGGVPMALVDRLRGGELDHELNKLGALLQEHVVLRLRVSNPKYLKQAGLD